MKDAQEVPSGKKEVSEFLITYVIMSFGLDLFLHLIQQEFIDVKRQIAVVVVHISATFILFSLIYLHVFFSHGKLVLFRKCIYLFVSPGVLVCVCVCLCLHCCVFLCLCGISQIKSLKNLKKFNLLVLFLVCCRKYSHVQQRALKFSHSSTDWMDINQNIDNSKSYSVQKFTYIQIVFFCFNVSCFQVVFINSMVQC